MISLHLPAKMSNPLVSIGVPVRNGGAYLADALQILVDQTYKNIEIIISDNNSSDDTSSIIERFAKLDKRIVVYTQSRTLTASENFRFVLDKSRGEYFMWAAHDDRRSLDYVEGLLNEFESDKDAVLAFGNVAVFDDHSNWINAAKKHHNFEQILSQTKLIDRVSSNVNRLCYHIYGLIKKKVLIDYSWGDIDYGPDRVLLFYLAERGNFIYSRKPIFYYFKPKTSKTKNQRALENSLKKLKPHPDFRLSFKCAQQLNPRSRNFLIVEGFKLIVFIFFLLFRYTRKVKKQLRLIG